jgi:hypothetical protein
LVCDWDKAKSEVDELLTSTLERDMKEVLEFQNKETHTWFDQDTPPVYSSGQIEVAIGGDCYHVGIISSTGKFWSDGRVIVLPSEYTWRVVG